MDDTSGQIMWVDLTVPDAEKVRDFYADVVGWTPSGVDMGGYFDFNMSTADGVPAAGVCWRRGTNAHIPPTWMIYITVEDIDASVARCMELGGEVIEPTREVGTGRMAIIRDPAGAVAGLYQA
jgi:uncharacterized protein